MFHAVILQKFFRDTAVAAADDQYVLHTRMDRHRHMGHHLVINKLVLLGEYDLPVQRDKFSKFLDPLIFTLPGKQLLFDLDGQLYVSGVQF